jgi:hypothetical protein
MTGYYGTTTCTKCTANADSCTSDSSFTCKTGYSKIGSATTCSKCPENASKCTTVATAATECNTGYVL